MGGKETKRVKASPASNNIKQRTENTFFLYSSYAERGGVNKIGKQIHFNCDLQVVRNVLEKKAALIMIDIHH